MGNLKIIKSNYTESKAIDQLENVLKMKDVDSVVGLPDLHPGKGIPIGAVAATKNIIYPHLIGNDIGCGIALFKTGKKVSKFKKEKTLKRLEEKNWYETEIDLSESINISNRSFDKKLGTIGKGNHFVELQVVDNIVDNFLFEQFGLNKKELYLMVHSGSRGYGEYVLDKYIRNYSAQNGIDVSSKEGQNYIKEHDDAVNWGKLNRELIAKRFFKISKMEKAITKLFDSVHNYLELRNNSYLHRKGAASSELDILAIPGSRGDYTYLVKPIADAKSLYSVAHGAGRKWNRTSCKSRLDSKYKKDDLKTTKFKSNVVCFDKALLYEEAPQAYKDVKTVIQALEEEGLIKVIAILKPIITYKN